MSVPPANPQLDVLVVVVGINPVSRKYETHLFADSSSHKKNEYIKFREMMALFSYMLDLNCSFHSKPWLQKNA